MLIFYKASIRTICIIMLRSIHVEAYSEPSQTSMMGLFARIVNNGWKPWTIFLKKIHLRCLWHGRHQCKMMQYAEEALWQRIWRHFSCLDCWVWFNLTIVVRLLLYFWACFITLKAFVIFKTFLVHFPFL